MDMNRLTQKSQEALHDAQTKAPRLRAHRGRRRAPAAAAARPAGRPSAAAARPGRAPTSTRCAPTWRPSCARRPRVTGPGAAPGQVYVTQRLARLLDAAEREARRLKDDYVSVEHLVLALIEEGPPAPPGGCCTERGVTRDGFLAGADRGAGNQRVTSATPEAAYEALEKYGRDLVAEAARGQARPGHRPGRGDPPGDPDPVPQDQEQPGPDRRSRRRQDRHRRGPGPADPPRRRARRAAGQDHLRPRHGRAGRRGQVPRRVRGAAQGGARRGEGAPRAGSCCSSTSCTRWSARAPPRARWTRATCSSRCSPAASCT